MTMLKITLKTDVRKMQAVFDRIQQHTKRIDVPLAEIDDFCRQLGDLLRRDKAFTFKTRVADGSGDNVLMVTVGPSKQLKELMKRAAA